MKRKLFSLLTIIVFMLTGCQLAIEGQNEDGLIQQDQLAGVVVTTEHLDLFDMEGYLEDNLNEIMSGKQPDQSEYQGRLYAQEVVEESTTEDGVPCVTKLYNFDHVDGISLLRYRAYTYLEDGTLHAEYTTGDCGEGLWDVCFGTELTEGTIHYPLGGGEIMVFLNPVFQDSEGRLYLMSGDGMHTAEPVGEMSMNYHEELTETVNGEETTRRSEFKITAKRVQIPEQVIVVQMNGDNQVISRVEYDPEKLPEELKVSPDCAYLIAEQRTGGEVSRQMLQPGDEELTVFVRSDKPYCLGRTMIILWSGGGME